MFRILLAAGLLMATAPSSMAATYIKDYLVTLNPSYPQVVEASFRIRDLNMDGIAQASEVYSSTVRYRRLDGDGNEGQWQQSGWLTITEIPIGTSILRTVHGRFFG